MSPGFPTITAHEDAGAPLYRVRMEAKAPLLDQMRHAMRLKHMSYRTEQAYISWVRCFIFFHHKRHPKDMGADEIRAFLTSLAVDAHVAASTQNSTLNALLFLYRHVLKQPFPELGEFERAKRPRQLPQDIARVRRRVADRHRFYTLATLINHPRWF